MRAGIALLALAASLPSAASGQVIYPPPDPSQFVGQAAVNAAVAAAALPDCPTAAPDTLLGSPGTGSRCARRADSTRPTPVQAINTTLAADCTWSVIFGRATTSASPIIHASVVLAAGATQPIPCSPLTRSTTSASGKCFPAQTTALNLSIITAGVTLNPTASTCTAGMPVMVTVREPTQ